MLYCYYDTIVTTAAERRRNVSSRGKVKAGRRVTRGRKEGEPQAGGSRRPSAVTGQGKLAKTSGTAGRPSFPRLKGREACGAMLRIAERSGNQRDDVFQVCELDLSGKSASGRGAGQGRRTRALTRTCQAMAAVGHPHRGRIMLKLRDY